MFRSKGNPYDNVRYTIYISLDQPKRILSVGDIKIRVGFAKVILKLLRLGLLQNREIGKQDVIECKIDLL